VTQLPATTKAPRTLRSVVDLRRLKAVLEADATAA
jgi:hypothetical protein